MSNIKPLTIGLGIGLVLGTLNGITFYRLTSNRIIPNQEQVQQGYISPNKLEIQCQDLDGNGKSETIMKIDDKSYLLREVDGNPMISAYEIKPDEVVPEQK